MRLISADSLDETLRFPDLVAALHAAFRSGIVTPPRQHHTIERGGAADATMLLMPAWSGRDVAASEGYVGAKIVSVFPDNPRKGRPSVVGVYLLFSGDTGEPVAMMDGPRLTLWRTAAASALAASYLARKDAERLVMVGAGALAPFLVRAHATVRPIREVAVWNRSPDAAERLVANLSKDARLTVRRATDLEAEVRVADIVSCATLSATPLVRGAWLKQGAHLDLVGAYTPAMRESDDEAVARASLFCDTRHGATHEGGDLAIPLAAGSIRESDIRADLFDLARGAHPGRANADEITLFKSVGTAIEDLAAAMLVWRQVGGR